MFPASVYIESRAVFEVDVGLLVCLGPWFVNPCDTEILVSLGLLIHLVWARYS